MFTTYPNETKGLVNVVNVSAGIFVQIRVLGLPELFCSDAAIILQ